MKDVVTKEGCVTVTKRNECIKNFITELDEPSERGYWILCAADSPAGEHDVESLWAYLNGPGRGLLSVGRVYSRYIPLLLRKYRSWVPHAMEFKCKRCGCPIVYHLKSNGKKICCYCAHSWM